MRTVVEVITYTKIEMERFVGDHFGTSTMLLGQVIFTENHHIMLSKTRLLVGTEECF